MKHKVQWRWIPRHATHGAEDLVNLHTLEALRATFRSQKLPCNQCSFSAEKNQLLPRPCCDPNHFAAMKNNAKHECP